MIKWLIIGIVIAVIVAVGVYYLSIQLTSTNTELADSGLSGNNSASIDNSQSEEDSLFNSYISCMADCRSSGDAGSSGICVGENCYPDLVQGVKQLGYNSSAPDEEFTSKLNEKNKAFVSCSTDCDYIEDKNEMYSCLDKCFAMR